MNPAAHLNRLPLLLFLAGLSLSPNGFAETYEHWIGTQFTAPEIAAGMASPLCDHDGDSCPNIFEYFGASLPKDKTSSFATIFSSEEMPGQITVHFPAALDRFDVEHVVLVSNDLLNWSEDAVFICHEDDLMYHLNGYQYVKVGIRPKPGIFIDTDGDGLLDFFEESLLSSDPNDAYHTLADILANDDFDNNGILNIYEEANTADGGGTFSKPSLLSATAVACAIDDLPALDPPALLVHTQLR